MLQFQNKSNEESKIINSQTFTTDTEVSLTDSLWGDSSLHCSKMQIARDGPVKHGG